MLKFTVVLVIIAFFLALFYEYSQYHRMRWESDDYRDDADIHGDCASCGYNPDGEGCRNESPHQFHCVGNPPHWECGDWKERR